MTWIKIHGAYVIVEKFAKLAERHLEQDNSRARWIPAVAAFAFESGKQKWKKLICRSKYPVYLFPKDVTTTAIKLKGSIDWLQKYNFIVPNDSIRIREDDVLSPAELIKSNRQYRNRYLYGPSWRADIITAIELGAKSPSDIVKSLGCSYEPAHRVFREYHLALKSAA